MCGVIGFYSPEHDAFHDVINGLFQMQHRGQDACGVAISDGRRVRLHKGMGYVREVFHEPPSEEFAGRIACGHVRYPTQGGNRAENTQPHKVTTLDGPILALCSNGDIVNYWGIREWLESRGVDFEGTNDGEVLLKYIAYLHVAEGLPLVRAIRRLQEDIRGAYSAVLVARDQLYAFRDPYAVRPMTFGTDGKDWLVASETPALDIARMDLVGEVEAGEIICWSAEGMVRMPHPDIVAARRGRPNTAHCVFEHIYFSRPDSIAYGDRAYGVRKRIGAWLAETEDVEADVVVPVPDSSNAVALGYAQASGLPFEIGLIRNHYVGRTFIRPDQTRRDEGVRMKFNPVRDVFKGKRVILVDDSIVRGTTSRKLVRMIRGAGAREIHMRVGSPVTAHSCFYGIDTPRRKELIGSRMSHDEIREYITADTLRYTSVEGLRASINDPDGYCFACFDGNYPIAVAEEKQMELVEAGD
jgi:amidophosphoribosyltransferase